VYETTRVTEETFD